VRNTKVTDEIRGDGIRGPFSVCDVVICVDVEAEFLDTLHECCQKTLDTRLERDQGEIRTLLNFSSPPSVLSIVVIHSWALLKRFLRDSLNGESHGSSLTTPTRVWNSGH
jgi:hypothetical protein